MFAAGNASGYPGLGSRMSCGGEALPIDSNNPPPSATSGFRTVTGFGSRPHLVC